MSIEQKIEQTICFLQQLHGKPYRERVACSMGAIAGLFTLLGCDSALPDAQQRAFRQLNQAWHAALFVPESEAQVADKEEEEMSPVWELLRLLYQHHEQIARTAFLQHQQKASHE
ncbi:hypothetical protein EI42_05741 [Thermosporothrix hazakensis]|jgi:predicted acylesterase/phospholipase RssA|uniref:Uncharacterized protein n=1 Tax=Thermosporothrix hazakensis TaxID=644383 RepID=A0A326TX59_THEHA|nr:hypothetical protein [Thermosporothrix hazakensis]PZW20980.1 hypothetical protein EI42_05741 [Thermosporothrix hazakensis]GCE49263.1 hypothetical protein KTH_41320 [Thermosporothrix hazakensis]